MILMIYFTESPIYARVTFTVLFTLKSIKGSAVIFTSFEEAVAFSVALTVATLTNVPFVITRQTTQRLT